MKTLNEQQIVDAIMLGMDKGDIRGFQTKNSHIPTEGKCIFLNFNGYKKQLCFPLSQLELLSNFVQKHNWVN